MIEITGYHDALAAFRSSVLRPDPDEPPLELRSGTLLRIDGREHALRRRALGTLLSGDNDEQLRQNILIPLLRAKARETLAVAAEDGCVRIDLVEWCTDVILRFAVRLIGLAPPDESDMNELLGVHSTIAETMSLRHRADAGEREALLERGLIAKRIFDEKYLSPALAQRRADVKARAGRTEVDESETAFDFLQLVATGADPHWQSHEIVLRETLVDFINAGTVTTVDAVLHTIDELSRFSDNAPESRAALADEKFLQDTVHEVLRLHESAPGFNRVATAEFALRDGTTLRPGDRLVIRVGAASRDPSVFGVDADEFRPGRAIPRGVYPYGLAFGSGRHMCYGVPLVLASPGKAGSAVCVVRQLLELGVRVDPQHPAQRLPHTVRDAFSSFPVLVPEDPESKGLVSQRTTTRPRGASANVNP